MALLDSRAAFVVWVYDAAADAVLAMTAQSPGCQQIVSPDDSVEGGLMGRKEFERRVWSEIRLVDHDPESDSGATRARGQCKNILYDLRDASVASEGPPVLLFSRSPVEELTHVAYEVSLCAPTQHTRAGVTDALCVVDSGRGVPWQLATRTVGRFLSLCLHGVP